MNENPFVPKPIDEVKKDIRSINNTINTIKIDIVCIKSQINQILEIIKEKEKEEKIPISKGWIW
tara:strand:- start:222 stop:413 length:192 start_codon:yes stop_codon:yes gene_type:complete